MINDFILKIERLSGKLFRTVHAIIGDRDDTLDLVQETLIKIYHKTKNAKIPLNDSYVIKTAYNLALNSKRNRNTRKTIEHEISSGKSEATFDNPLFLLEQKENRSELFKAMQELSDRQREIISYRFNADMKIPEIAKLLSISEGSVKVYLTRGLQKMKNILIAGERI